jgi:hypothetical protein
MLHEKITDSRRKGQNEIGIGEYIKRFLFSVDWR